MQGVSSPSVHANTATPSEQPALSHASLDIVPPVFPLERSDFSRLSTDELSLTSEQRRVSFNSDISVKRIPKPRHYKTLPLTLKRDELESGPFASAVRQEPPTSEKDIASEARLILTQLEGVQCSVSPTPNSTSSGFGTPTGVLPHSASSVVRSASCGAAAGGSNTVFGPSHSKVGSSASFHTNKRPNLNSNASCSSTQSYHHHRPLWKQSSEQLEQHHQQRKIPTQTSSKFITNRTSSGGSASNEDSSWQSSGVHSATEDSYRSSSLTSTLSRRPLHEDDLTSQLRREQNSLYGLHALNNLDIAVNGRVVNSMPSYQEIRRQISLENSTGSDRHLHNQSPPAVKRNQVLSPPKPPRKSTSVSPIPPVKRSSMEVIHYAQPVSSRGNPGQSAKMVSSVMEQLSQDAKFRRGMMANSAMEDDDITSTMTSSYSSQNLRRSPTRNLAPSPSRISPSRTCMTDTELLRSPTEVLYAVSDKHKHHHNERLADSASQTIHNDIHPRYHQPPSHHHRTSRASSREDLLSDVPSSYRNGELNNRVMSRSADPYRYRDDDKENNFKARIQVVSPDRVASVDRFNRKPYKTTINTATDNIQYRGNTLNNKNNSNLYQKNHHHSYRNRSSETEHYKVPKNKAPVEYFGNGSIRPASVQSLQYHDSDQSSINPYNGQSRFASTRLVKNADTVNSKRHHSQHHLNGRELDREGRTIRRSTEGRGRTYSGCSTSPDRETSPDRSSPTRPPRSRSSPAKEIIGNVIRRATNHSGPPRQVERTPSNRAQTSARHPIKDIRRVHNDFRREHSSPSIRATEESEDRLSKFTEYRGDDSSSYNQRVDRRGSSVAYDHRRQNDDYSSVEDRERGQSLPPGATIDSIRDFYKSSQFKSMYALPPSPSRPAPVLDRAPSTSTLSRRDHSVGRSKRPNRVSISEGEITDDANRIGSLQRPRPPKVMNSAAAMSQHGSHRPIPPARKASTKRQAPSPPGQPRLIRRVVSSDRDERGHHGMTDQMRRVASADRGLQHPPARKPLGRQTSMGEPLDSSFSESDGLIPEQRPWSSVSEEELEFEIDALTNELDRAPSMSQLSTTSSRLRPMSHRSAATTTVIHLHQPKERRGNAIIYDKTPTLSYTFIQDRVNDSGRRWTAAQSDLESDYRRDLATSGLHHEARGRDGGGGGGGGGSIAGINSGTLRKRSLDRRRDSGASPVGRASSTAREEERRKVLEIEEERLRREREVQLRRNAAIGRSNSRVNRAGLTSQGLGPKSRSRQLLDDHESQYSGHSSSSAMRKDPIKVNRVEPHNRIIRVKRNPSNAASANGALNGGARSTLNRKKMPGSVTSSINSSESEQGSQGAGGSNANAQRSVFLHAACVADIPTPAEKRIPPPRALSAESRENLNRNATQGTGGGPPQSNLKNSKKISRSISLLAPWKPRNVQRNQEIHYNNGAMFNGGGGGGASGKPPRPPPVARRSATMQRDKKSASSSDLLQSDPLPPPQSPPSPEMPMVIGEQRSGVRAATNGAGGKPSSKVSRSVSMPKDSRLAGWFKKRKRV
ncbi:uncharacterized protein LOC131885497 isoform X2 [Tigriopus californicus]|uniref:uncharacterized protein LOC131885497 isoform X2 n=1 Tax=Tigriopus californicus TaxID=6832 RepID=UPI0027D9DE55|nr:uncharacterized protein LOC131885497 isoform X2 [Tigriopus californicus]